MRTFYSDSLRRVLETLNTDPDRGLSGQEAARRLAAEGEEDLYVVTCFSDRDKLLEHTQAEA